MSYNIYIGKDTYIHHKNEEGLKLFFDKGYLKETKNAEESDIILFTSSSPNNSGSINDIDIDDDKYKNKIIILGPHFSVLPTRYIASLMNKNNNIVYNSLSEWVVDLWEKFLPNKNFPIITIPYPVNVELFKPSNQNNKNVIIIYIKNRVPSDYEFIIEYVNETYGNNYKIMIFNYRNTYKQDNFIEALSNAYFCIWIGTHESQGFALQETLSMNVPILVFNVHAMSQEQGQENDPSYRFNATSIPYWSDKCGEYFITKEEFYSTLLIFLSKIKDNYYSPRKFILDNLSPDTCFNIFWKPIIDKYCICNL
jgi:hypothetical protein